MTTCIANVRVYDRLKCFKDASMDGVWEWEAFQDKRSSGVVHNFAGGGGDRSSVQPDVARVLFSVEHVHATSFKRHEILAQVLSALIV